MSASTNIADLRENYKKGELLLESVADSPLDQFTHWFEQALSAGIVEPNAMTLSTVNAQGQPSSRTVLLKGADDTGLHLYTNYNSHKGQDLAANPKAAINILWKELERQVCIQGTIKKSPRQQSEAYFHSRPHLSQIGAWVSETQSGEIPNREHLAQREAELLEQYPEGTRVPLPPFWGGYTLTPDHIEFWQGRPSRLHDRILYTKDNTNAWTTSRLSP